MNKNNNRNNKDGKRRDSMSCREHTGEVKALDVKVRDETIIRSCYIKSDRQINIIFPE